MNQLLYAPDVLQQAIHTLLTTFPLLDQTDVHTQVQEAKTALEEAIATNLMSIDLTNTYLATLLQDPSQHVISECSQSVMLSLSGGQYPFVTSSEC